MQPSCREFTPATTKEEALRTACQLWGVQQDYWDIFGTQHVASLEVLEAVLKSCDPSQAPGGLVADHGGHCRRESL
jgi:hypothetical protein